MVYNFFNKRTSGSAIKKGNISNKEFAQELHKPIIKNFNKRKVQSGFKDNILGVDPGDMQLISNFNRWFRSLLWVTDIFSKYAWVIPLKGKKGITITNGF